MNQEEFIALIRAEITDQNMVMYHDLFTNTPESKATDPYWRRALRLFSDLNSDQRIVFFEVIREIMVGTISNLLMILGDINLE